MTNLTIHDLIGEDHTIWANKTDATHVEIEIYDEQQRPVYIENTHVYAWEALVTFAKQVLAEDKRLNQGEK